jgi:hypothetical protein
MFDSGEVEFETWLAGELGFGAKWLSVRLAGGGELEALLCETLAAEEELEAEFVEALGAGLGAGVGAGLGLGMGAALGGGLLGALDS